MLNLFVPIFWDPFSPGQGHRGFFNAKIRMRLSPGSHLLWPTPASPWVLLCIISLPSSCSCPSSTPTLNPKPYTRGVSESNITLTPEDWEYRAEGRDCIVAGCVSLGRSQKQVAAWQAILGGFSSSSGPDVMTPQAEGDVMPLHTDNIQGLTDLCAVPFGPISGSPPKGNVYWGGT